MNGTIGNRKKNTILLLLVVSVVCMMSMNAFAAAYVAKVGPKSYKTLQSAVNAAKNGQTVKLLKAVNASKTVTVSGKKITIDFAKKKYNYKPKTGYAFRLKSGALTIRGANLISKNGSVDVDSGARLTINSGSITGSISNKGIMLVKNGKFKGAGTEEDDEGGSLRLAAVENRGTLTVQKGTFTGSARPLINNYAKAIIKGGTYTCTNTEKNVYYFAIDNLGGKGCVMSIEGGKFKGTIYNNCNYNGRLMITGGTFTADKGQAPVKNADGNVLIAGGKFTASDCYALINMYDDETYEGGTVVITGGTFKAAGSEAAIVNEAELVITGGTFLLNGAKKDAVKCYKLDDSSLWYISDSLGLTPVVGG